MDTACNEVQSGLRCWRSRLLCVFILLCIVMVVILENGPYTFFAVCWSLSEGCSKSNISPFSCAFLQKMPCHINLFYYKPSRTQDPNKFRKQDLIPKITICNMSSFVLLLVCLCVCVWGGGGGGEERAGREGEAILIALTRFKDALCVI